MELPFYLMTPESPGTAWNGVISLHGDELHFELRATGGAESTAFDLPLETISRAQFQRGLVSRTLCLTVRNEELRGQFPAGVAGEEVRLMVARDDSEFEEGPGKEAEFERLAGQIATRRESGADFGREGLAS